MYFFGGLVKHQPESVPESGHHPGDHGREHYDHPRCDREHPTGAHASSHAGEEAVGKALPVATVHRDVGRGEFVAEASEVQTAIRADEGERRVAAWTLGQAYLPPVRPSAGTP